MAYSTSPYTLVKIEMELMPLASGKTIKWLRPANERQGWASNQGYKVREAMKIALLYPERFPALAKVAEHVTVKILSATEVEARVDIKVPASTVVSEPLAAPVHRPSATRQDYALLPMDEVKQVIAEWEGSGVAHYDKTVLGPEQLRELALWADKQVPKLMVVYGRRTTSLTIALDDPEVPQDARVQP